MIYITSFVQVYLDLVVFLKPLLIYSAICCVDTWCNLSTYMYIHMYLHIYMNEHINEIIKIVFVELSNCGERDDSLKNSVAKNNLLIFLLSSQFCLNMVVWGQGFGVGFWIRNCWGLSLQFIGFGACGVEPSELVGAFYVNIKG